LSGTRAQAQTTEILDDGVELEPELPDEPPQYPRWLKAGQRWAVLVDAVDYEHPDYNKVPGIQIEGELAAPALQFDENGNEVTLPAGTSVCVNASPKSRPILDRQLKANDRKYGLVGRIAYITYKGELRTKVGRTTKDFDVRPSKPISFDKFDRESES
jgi:hypothetical protein